VIPPQIAQVLPPASDASWPQVAGLDGLRFETPEGLQLDFHPHSRFRTDPQGLILLSGGALVHFPETGARLYLPEGHYLEARDTLCEVHSVEEDGILDVLDPQILVHSEGGEITPVHPLQRWYFSEGLASPIPVTEAGMLLRRLAWFRSGNRRTQAPVLARQLALRTLRAVEGSDREEIARETLRVAQEWVTRVARRYRDEAFARL
jgi:hypothetical protein